MCNNNIYSFGLLRLIDLDLPLQLLLLLAVSLCFKVLAIHGPDQEVQHGRHTHQARQAVQRRVVQQGGRVHRALSLAGSLGSLAES